MNNCWLKQLIYLWTIIIIALISECRSEGITCFKCTVAPVYIENKKTSQICNHFDGSEKFQVDCPQSTLCMKRTIHHRLRNGTIINTSVERGCTPQLDRFQAYDFDKRKWNVKERIVQTAYKEGCITGEDRGSPGGPPEYCFCSGDLCNSSISLNKNMLSFITIGLIIQLIS
ncbi:uncharacterized protein LOC122852215 [Aphidius gifuensis]|uniref:uncharacterized protein LOC122852215 n=1 Tax=Aphidius gifuensis TaxID=684658 RepID=UPI001CDC4954|nr:uncharacterized protein LOC122852215 [Aphidius gifuensis]